MKCPECGSVQYKESRQCPRFKGVPVCINCCLKCEAHNKKSLWPCGFWIVRKFKDKKMEIDREILFNEAQLEKYKDNEIMRAMIIKKISGYKQML